MITDTQIVFQIVAWTSVFVILIGVLTNAFMMFSVLRYFMSQIMTIYKDTEKNKAIQSESGYLSMLYVLLSVTSFNIFFLFYPELIKNEVVNFSWIGYTTSLTSCYQLLFVVSLVGFSWSYMKRRKFLKSLAK